MAGVVCRQVKLDIANGGLLSEILSGLCEAVLQNGGSLA
jgi:hypothetical protein